MYSFLSTFSIVKTSSRFLPLSWRNLFQRTSFSRNVISDKIFIDENQKFSKNFFRLPLFYEHYIESVIIPSSKISIRVESLANEIIKDYKDKKNLHLLCVLKGKSI
jgi:hypothetical protein